MKPEQLKEKLSLGEGQSVEFKAQYSVGGGEKGTKSGGSGPGGPRGGLNGTRQQFFATLLRNS